MVAPTQYLIEYIKSVCKNSLNNPSNKDPLNMNVIISGGAFNCGYGYGAILYLKELQSQQKINIHKVSGSILTLTALCDEMIDLDLLYIQLQEHFREYGNLNKIRDIVKTIVYKCVKDDVHAKTFSDKLYITTTDMSTCKQMVISRYTSRKQLAECIMSSCYIPYLMNQPNVKYIDGIVPYLFKNGTTPSLYINLIQLQKTKNIIFTTSEVNPHYRVIEGVVETAKLFNEGKSSMCSWINDWNVFDFCMLRLFQLIFMLTTITIDTLYHFELPNIIKNNIIFKCISNCMIPFIHDCMFRCFIVAL